jgi:hypothetical protein
MLIGIEQAKERRLVYKGQESEVWSKSARQWKGGDQVSRRTVDSREVRAQDLLHLRLVVEYRLRCMS